MSDRMTTTLTRPVDVLLDIPSDAPRWYRHWIVLEAYIRAVVCWGQYRYNGEDRKERLRPVAAAAWIEREGMENNDLILRHLDGIVKNEGYPLSAREILNEAVQLTRYELAMKEFKDRVRHRYDYYTTHFPPREGSCINIPAMCEGEVIGEIQRECLARGYSNWYGPFRNVRGL